MSPAGPATPATPDASAQIRTADAAPDSTGRLTLQGDASRLPQSADGVTINRPDPAAPAASPAAVPPVAPPEAEVIVVPDGPALSRFAVAFANPSALPEMAIILIDTGDMADAAAAVAAIGFPVTIAIDPARPGAAAAMAAYRAQGREVMMLARLPVGARPVDVEVVLEAAFATLPEAVAVLDAGEGGLQSGSAVARQALRRLAADGRGLVVMDGGLNSIDRDAAEAGVPAALVQRDLDGEGQDDRVIRRFLDDAAFRARQQGQVVVLARIRPDTLTALQFWGAADRAGQVALAPISAILAPGSP